VAAGIRLALVIVVAGTLLLLSTSIDWTAYGLAVLIVILSGGVVIASRRGQPSIWLQRGAITVEVVLLCEWMRSVSGQEVTIGPGIQLSFDAKSLFLLAYVPVLVSAITDGTGGALLTACLAILAFVSRIAHTAAAIQAILLDMALSHFVPLLVVAALMGYLVSVADRERRARAQRDVELVQFRHTLALAAEMQEAIRPEIAANIPNAEVLVRQSVAERSVGGGDFCAIVPVGADVYAVAVADVAGKTLAGLATMPLAYAAFWVASHHHPAAEDCLADIDRLLESATRPDVFVAIFVGRYDASTGELTYCNAGQPDGLLVTPAGVSRLTAGGPAAGAVPPDARRPYESATVRLEPGDLLILGTDGVLGNEEAAERMAKLATEVSDLGRLADSVMGMCDPSDDRALLLLRRASPEGSTGGGGRGEALEG